MMGLFTTAVAFAAGYTLGNPGGRQQAMAYLQQVRAQGRNPQAERVLDRGRRLVADRLRVAAQRTEASRGPSTRSAAPVAASASLGSGRAGFGATTVEEDPDAVRLGLDTPSPSPRPGTPGSPPAGS